jgi:hypothetical protein
MCERSESTCSPDETIRDGSRKPSVPFILAGAAVLGWFLLRVLPKPSRAAYPCQRVAFPIASTFVIWLLGTFGAALAVRRGRPVWRQTRILSTSACLAAVAVIGLTALNGASDGVDPALPDPPNEPIGEAIGLNPGRVVWVHDPEATDWEGPGHGHWWEAAHTNQGAVDQMVAEAICHLAGEYSLASAWDDLIRHFNQTHGFGNVGYVPGEKITIKVNFVGTHALGGGVDIQTWNLTWQDYPNTSPQVITALLRHLVDVLGVAQADISVGDDLSLFCNEYYNIIHAEFPDIQFLDCYGGNASHPRTPVQDSNIPVYWSSRPTQLNQDYVPLTFAEAKYIINIANLKSHTMAGVTLCGKNHFGSRLRQPFADGYYDLHQDLPILAPAEGSYRNIVDMIGHAHMGGKTLLCFVDGLYPGIVGVGTVPIRWPNPPFNGDWTSSLFASQDPIAIDSVCFDFLQQEGYPTQYPHMAAADDYLHEGALAHDPPSGTFYDPDHESNVVRLESLGVHEHWNNPIDMQYTRNLGTGDGIELIQVQTPTAVEETPDASAVVLSNHPNPFNPMTTVSFTLPNAGHAVVAIYDAKGQMVVQLVDEVLAAGPHTVDWDGRDAYGASMPSGTYFCRLATSWGVETRKMSLLR